MRAVKDRPPTLDYSPPAPRRRMPASIAKGLAVTCYAVGIFLCGVSLGILTAPGEMEGRLLFLNVMRISIGAVFCFLGMRLDRPQNGKNAQNFKLQAKKRWDDAMNHIQ
jgi:hypothetical protein